LKTAKAGGTTMRENDSPGAVKPSWRKRVRWDLFFAVAAIATALILSLLFRDKGALTWRVSWQYLKEMVFILPAVMIIVGLFAVWVDRSMVVKYLGKESGLPGLLISVALGTLPTGPLYVAFPLAAMLLKKGARVANVLAFLCSWAALSIPAELMELRFMGWKFTLLRLALTFMLIIPLAWMGEFIYRRGEAGRLALNEVE